MHSRVEHQRRYLLLSDIHYDLDKCAAVIDWAIQQPKWTNVLLSGDIISIGDEERDDKKRQEIGLEQVKSVLLLLETIPSNGVLYIGGNHDPDDLLYNPASTTLSILSSSRNLHKTFYIDPSDNLSVPKLIFVGLGGSTPAFRESGAQSWVGYPYQSDSDFARDLTSTIQNVQSQVVDSNAQFILFSHIGPYRSSTSVDSRVIEDPTYAGSAAIDSLLLNEKRLFLNIHGHIHAGRGHCRRGRVSVINPGSLTEGNFGTLILGVVSPTTGEEKKTINPNDTMKIWKVLENNFYTLPND